MKRITSSLLALLLALSMLIGMVPAAYAAPADTIESIDSTETVDSSETEDVSDESKEVAVYATTEGKAAKIGDNEYDTLAEAFAAAVTGDTVTLMRNVDLNGSSLRLYPSDTGVHNLTLDLARYKITSNIKSYVVAAAREGLVIKNGTIENTNTSTAKTTSAVYVTNAGTTTFENVQITSKGAGVRVQLKTGVATVNVGNGTAIDAKYGVHLANPTNTSTTKSGTEILNVNGGTITGSTWGVLAECASSSYTNASVGVNIKAGSVNSVNVNTNTATSKNDPVKLEISGGVITGNVKSNGTADEISISGGEIQGSITNNGTLTISGGTIGGSLTNGTNGAISVTGGTFTTADPSDYLADGYEFVNGQVTSSSSTTAITTSEQLIAAIAAANDGDTITLGEGEFSTYRNTSPNKSLTFVGSGEKTRWMIGNIPALDKEGEYNSDYSFDGCETITFKNMTMVNGAANYLGFVRIDNSNFENCTFEGRGSYWGYKTATFTKCTFNAPEGDYALWDYSTKDMTFDGCTFNISGKGVNVYVEAGNAGSAPRAVTVKDCTVNSTAKDKAFLNIKNSTQAYDVTFSGTNTVTGLAVNDTTNSNLFQVQTTEVTETSGKPVTVKETADDGTENVIYEVKADTVPSGYVEDENGNVSISDADGLFWLAKQVNENGNTFAGKTVVLAADIDLKNAAWTPIGTSTNQFKGTFDGQNKTISNISANCPSMENVGLFGFTTNCTLKNVTLENVDIKGKKNVGGLAGTVYAGSTVENVTVKGNIKISASVQYVGGIAGYSYAKYVNCKVIGDGADSSYIQDTLVGDYTNYAGGIVGLYGEGAAGITGCEVSDITIRTVGYGAGGITGVLQYNNRVSDCKVKNVVIDSQPADSNGWAGTLAGKDYTKNGSNTSWLINNTIENTVIKVGGVEIANQYMGDDHTGTYPPHEEYEANAIIGTDVEYDESGKITAGTFITVGAKARETLESSISDSKSLSKGSDDTYNVTEKKAYVAEINGTGYETLAEAVKAAAAGDTITLLSDIKLTSVQTISKKLTLDLNGKTLDSTAYRTIQLNSGANLTVQDSVGNGKIANSYNGGSYPSTVYLNAKDTVFTLVSGTIESDPYKTSLQSVAINSLKDKACTVNIQGGSVVVPAAAKEGRAIVASTNSMTLNISDGKIAGGLHGIDAYSGSTVNITGGKVTATYVDTGVIKEAYGMRIIGTANVTINGGEIQGIKMDDDGYKLNVPNVTLVSGKVNGSFYSISTGTIVFTVEPTATITFEKDTVKNFLPSTVELVQNTDGTYGVKKGSYVAEINGKQYASLSDAIAAAKDGAEIRLLSDVTENGMDIEKSFTLDFNTHTLTVEDPMVGSTGTKTNAIRFLKNGDTTNTVVLKNGSIKSSKARILIQNYANLTVDNMVLDLSEQPLYGYVLSNNNGVTVINNSKISAPTAAGSLAFDACAFSTYGDVSVTLRGNSVINGDVGFSRDGNGTQNASLTLESGKINGNLVDVGKGETVTVTKSNDVTLDAPTGYKWVDGTLTKITYVAEVNGTTFETLVDAIAAAKDNDTVTLLADTTEDVVISKNITLDLNGFTLTNTEGEHTIVNNGTLTIKDSSTAQTGTVDNVTHGCGALVNNGTVILSGGTFERSAEKGKFEPYGNGGNSWYTIANYGTMTINNGTTVKNAGGYSSNIRNGGQDSTAKLTINGGTFDGGVNTVKNDANGVLEIKGGELKNTAQYVIMNWNQATISGGTFETAETAGAVLFSSAYGTDGTACGELTITGGTFTAAGSKLIDDAYDANNHGTVKISGGSFNRAVDPKHCDTGFIPTQNEDGTYGVKEGTYVAETGGVYYESLQAAIDAAPRKGTVKLLADTRENVTINTPYLTLDLNGHTLNGGTEKGKPALTVTARVTVKDGSEAQTGTIMREDTAENSGVSSHYVIDIQGSGWLTFESGNVKNGSGVVGVKGASLVRVGDDSVAKYPGLNIKGGTFTQDNFIVIKVDRGDLFLNGGTLNSANSYAIEDWHRATIKGGTVNGAVAAWTYSGGLNSDLTISGGTINGDVTSVNYGNAEGRTAKVSITGGRVTGKLDTRSYDPATNELTSIDDAAKATIEVTGGTFNNDPTKYVVENSKVTNNADGTFGVEKAYLAKIGDKSYYTMDEAFHAVTEGQTIVLLRDYTTASSQNSGSKSFTFDLNGHTWTYTSTDVNYAAFEINYPDVTLTVKNGKVVSNSMLGLIPSAMGGTITYDNAGLVFEGIDATANGHSGIETNGNNTNDSVTLKNSTLNVPNGFGIYFPSSGTLTIENSKINAKTMGVQVCAGSLKISGADTAITVTGDAVPKTENDGAIQDGAAISIVNRTGYKGLGTITVTGGTFTAKTGNAAIKAYNYADKTESSFNESDKVEVSGGTFSAEVPADLCAVGYEPTKMDTGMYTVQKVSGNAYYVDDSGKPVYGDFAALVASTNAATKGKTITLLKNVKIEDNLVLFGNRTVDLNGNVLEITEIFIGLYGKVIDSSDGNGLLKIAADNVTLQSDNGLLPIYDSAKGGYRLFSFTMKQQVTKPSDTTVKFKFGPIFENKEAYKLLLTGNNHNIKVTVTLKWISGDGRTGEQTFTFPQNLINGIGAAEGGSGFVINLTGFDSDITGSVSNVTAQWAISSGTGASVSGTPSVIYE